MTKKFLIIFSAFFIAMSYGMQANNKVLRPGEQYHAYDLDYYIKYPENLNAPWAALEKTLSLRYDYLAAHDREITAQALNNKNIKAICDNYAHALNLAQEPFFSNHNQFKKLFEQEIGLVPAFFADIATWHCVSYVRHVSPTLKLEYLKKMLESIITQDAIKTILRNLEESNCLTKKVLKRIFCNHPKIIVVEKTNNDKTVSIGCYVMPHAPLAYGMWAISETMESCSYGLTWAKRAGQRTWNATRQKGSDLMHACKAGTIATWDGVTSERVLNKRTLIAALLLIALAYGGHMAHEHQDVIITWLQTFYESLPTLTRSQEWLTELWYWTKARLTGYEIAPDTCPALNLSSHVPQGPVPPISELLENVCFKGDLPTSDPTFCRNFELGEPGFCCPDFDHTLNLLPNPLHSLLSNFSKNVQQTIVACLKKLMEAGKNIPLSQLAHAEMSQREFIMQLRSLMAETNNVDLASHLNVAYLTELGLPPII